MPGTWSAPRMERMTAWPTPAALAAVSRLSIVVWNHAGEASSKVGEFVRLTTTSAPSTASGRPSVLSRSRPVDGDCGAAWCPYAFRILTTCDPTSPVPPMTAIFISLASFALRSAARLVSAGPLRYEIAVSSGAGPADSDAGQAHHRPRT